MKNISYKWFVMSLGAYIGGSILVSAVFTISLMAVFAHIEPAQLRLVEPTATIIHVTEPLIGFTLALCVARWLVDKTHHFAANTIWLLAAALTIYGVISVLLNPTAPLLTALPKLFGPWLVALLAIKWSGYTQAV